jgi:hypothetical protein
MQDVPDIDEPVFPKPPGAPKPDPLEALQRQYANLERRSRFGLRIARDEKSPSYPSTVIGVVSDKRYLILTAPTAEDGSPVAIAKGETWVCRLFNATTVFRFSASVLKVAHEPFPYLYVELPSAIERRMVRKQPRALAALKARLDRPDGRKAVVTDISVTGVRLAVAATTSLSKDSAVLLHADIGMMERTFKLALALRIGPEFGAADSAHPSVHFYGAMFENLSDNSKLVLQGYVHAQLSEELDRLSRVLAIEEAFKASQEERK